MSQDGYGDQTELELLQLAADATQPTDEKRARMRAALARYVQGRAYLGRASGDGPIDPIEPVEGVRPIE